MSTLRELVLVPKPILNSLMNNKSVNPDIVSKISTEMTALLNTNNIMSDSDTRIRYDDLASQKRSFTKTDDLNMSQNVKGRQIILPTLSDQTQKRANVILDLLSSSDDTSKNLQFDSNGNWVVANQQRGNLRDLLHDTLTPSLQPRQIAFKDDWLRYLATNNIPEYLIKNVWVKNEVKNIKTLALPHTPLVTPVMHVTTPHNISTNATPTMSVKISPTMQGHTPQLPHHLLGDLSGIRESILTPRKYVKNYEEKIKIHKNLLEIALQQSA
jgi:hypothetical protein